MKSNFPVISSPPTTRFTPLHLLGKLNTLTKYLPLSLCFLPTPLLAQIARKRTYNSFSNPSWLWGINLGSLAHSLTRFTPNILLPECTKNRQLHFAHVKFFPPVLLFFSSSFYFSFFSLHSHFVILSKLSWTSVWVCFCNFFPFTSLQGKPKQQPCIQQTQPQKMGKVEGQITWPNPKLPTCETQWRWRGEGGYEPMNMYSAGAAGN